VGYIHSYEKINKIKFHKLSNSAKVFYVDVTGIIGEDHSRLQTE
jgi:hypothetical protein